MKRNMWMNLVMAVLVSGLFFTISCTKKTVVTDEAAIQDQQDLEADMKAKAQMEKDRMKQMKIDEQMAKERAMKEAMAMAKADFIKQDVLFAYNSSDLDADAVTLLRTKAAWLTANKGETVTIEGHCDERGTTEYNLALGERRASAVKAYLVNLGIDQSRLSTISYGEERPKVMGTTEEAYRLNRRAHFDAD
jgi:peptidoglycan-associated lipoprotein